MCINGAAFRRRQLGDPATHMPPPIIEPSEYDLVVVGTGLVESIVAA